MHVAEHGRFNRNIGNLHTDEVFLPSKQGGFYEGLVTHPEQNVVNTTKSATEGQGDADSDVVRAPRRVCHAIGMLIAWQGPGQRGKNNNREEDHERRREQRQSDSWFHYQDY